jgi:hypothetical protein
VRRTISHNQLVAAAPKLVSLMALGFIAVIYLPAGWPEITVLVLAIGCGLVALIGYGLRWKERPDGFESN